MVFINCKDDIRSKGSISSFAKPYQPLSRKPVPLANGLHHQKPEVYVRSHRLVVSLAGNKRQQRFSSMHVVLPYCEPQTSRATLATSSSLRRCSSGEIRLPSIVDANPHCGLRARRSNGIYCEASSMRCRSSAAVSSRGFLVVTKPRTTKRSSGTCRSGSNPPERESSYSRRKRWNRVWGNMREIGS